MFYPGKTRVVPLERCSSMLNQWCFFFLFRLVNYTFSTAVHVCFYTGNRLESSRTQFYIYQKDFLSEGDFVGIIVYSKHLLLCKNLLFEFNILFESDVGNISQICLPMFDTALALLLAYITCFFSLVEIHCIKYFVICK